MSAPAPADPPWAAWETESRPAAPRPAGVLALAALATLALVVGMALSWAVGVAVAAALIAAGLVWWSAQARLALRAVGARRLAPGEAPRLPNIVEGLASLLGAPVPALYVSEREGVNALACASRGGALVLTRAALTELTRTELEAVVAHCLIRLHSGKTARAQAGAAFGALAGPIPAVGTEDDVRTCAVTRYPPALMAALRKAHPEGGRFAPLWFVAHHPAHRSVEERIAALSDL